MRWMRWMRLMPFPGRIPPQASSESGVRLLGPVYMEVGTSGLVQTSIFTCTEPNYNLGRLE